MEVLKFYECMTLRSSQILENKKYEILFVFSSLFSKFHPDTVNPQISPLGLIYLLYFWTRAYSKGGLYEGGAYKIIVDIIKRPCLF